MYCAHFEPENEDDLERPRPRALVIEDRNAAAGRTFGGHAGALERSEHIVSRQVTIMSADCRELPERSLGYAVRTSVQPGVVSRRRRLEPPGVSHHEREQPARSLHRILDPSKVDERGHGRAPKLLSLLVDPHRIGDGSAAEASLHEVHRATLEPGER